MPTLLVPTTAGICNRALRHLAIGKPIASLTENSENARACADFYDEVRDEVLRDFNWPFARRFAALALVGGTATLAVTPEWQYSYRLPDGCLAVRRLMSGSRVETPTTRIPFATGGDDTGGLLYTDQAVVAATSSTLALPHLEYTASVTAEARFPVDFAQAFSFKLAFYLAPELTGGDPNKLGARAGGMYERILSGAQLAALYEQQRDVEPVDSEFIRARD
jgi:hypothetical protein